METEGQGSKAPAPKRISLSRGDLRAILIESERRAEFRKYKKRKDAWGQGLTGSLEIDGVGRLLKAVRPIFCGFVGEYAVAREFHESIDTTLRRAGDRGVDLVVAGLPIQVKTCEGSCCANLIRVVDGAGRRVEHGARVVVFCNWLVADAVCIRGWVWMKDALARPHVPARIGDHLNVEIANSGLLPIGSLKDEIAARRALLSGTH